ncbi:MAG: response regulator [Opitutae bacterium]|nr:response regulator [Opitutae bacterium]
MSESATKSNPPMAPKKALRILHVDDMRQLCDIVRQSLARDGHVVESFADGAAALARIKQNPREFDVFISDHHMPKMNGLEVVRELRKIDFRGRIFIFSSEIDEEVNDIPELRQLLAEI